MTDPNVPPFIRNMIYEAILRAEDDPDNNGIDFAHRFDELAEEVGVEEAQVRAVVAELKADKIAKASFKHDENEAFVLELHKVKSWRRRLGL